tara:strand:- start:664 stop:828 length:165 start_codon:yes stop_codon:yes gene_type:complete
MRKILLIGLPIFFRPGTIEQLVLGQLVCFLAFGTPARHPMHPPRSPSSGGTHMR